MISEAAKTLREKKRQVCPVVYRMHPLRDAAAALHALAARERYGKVVLVP